MIYKYCVDCTNFERRPVMVEVPMDSGNRIQNGWYHRCNVSGRIFHTQLMSEETKGCLTCSCGGFCEKGE